MKATRTSTPSSPHDSTLYPISTIPATATRDTVVLYEESKGWWGQASVRFASQELIMTCPRNPNDPKEAKAAFWADVEGAKWWQHRQPKST